MASVRRVVLGTPGLVDPNTGDIAFAWDLPRWHRGLLGALRADLSTPVVFGNDVNLAAVAEAHTGAAEGVDDFVLIWVGRGVGLATVIEGRLHHGSTGAAGEIGYLPVAGTQIPRNASRRGVKGAFQTLAGADAVRAIGREHGFRHAEAADVVRAAVAAGEPGEPVLDELARRLALGVAATCLVLDPPLVVLAGEVGQAGGRALAERVERRSPRSPWSHRRGRGQPGRGRAGAARRAAHRPRRRTRRGLRLHNRVTPPRPAGGAGIVAWLDGSVLEAGLPTQIDPPQVDEDTVIALDRVSVIRGGNHLLRGLSWQVELDERWVILGPNGAGKTTLLNLASARMHPSRGTAHVLGERLGRTDVSELRTRIGFTIGAARRQDPRRGTGRRRRRHRGLVRRRPLAGELRPAGRGAGPRPAGPARHGRAGRPRVRHAVRGRAQAGADRPGADDRPRADAARRARRRARPGRPRGPGRPGSPSWPQDPDAPAMVLVTHHVEEIPPGFTHALLLREGTVVASGLLGETLTGGEPVQDLRPAAGRAPVRRPVTPPGPPEGSRS